MQQKIIGSLVLTLIFLTSCSTGMQERSLSYEEFINQEYKYIQNDIKKIREKLAKLEKENSKQGDQLYHELLSLQEHSTNLILYNANKERLSSPEHQELIHVISKYKYVSFFLDYAIKQENEPLLNECLLILEEGEKDLADLELLYPTTTHIASKQELKKGTPN